MPSLNWAGKDKVINHHLDVPMHVLERTYGFDERGRHEETAGSGNMIIHGDNLTALKALLPRFEGRVDCIYIDPPYNTGNEGWVYNDNVNDPQIRKWLGEVVGKEGEDFSRHDKWLCMMYPRLRLLHRLLAPDGVIFISIDDNEQANLRLICDEIFGANNFVSTFVWTRKKKGSFLSKKIRKMSEYVCCYQKDMRVQVELYGESAYSDKWQPIVKRTNAKKTLTIPAGIVSTKLSDGIVKKGFYGKEGTGLLFIEDLVVKDGIVTSPIVVEGRFTWQQSFLEEELRNGTKIDLSTKFGFNVLRYDQANKSKAPSTLISGEVGVGTNEDATEELQAIFGASPNEVFQYSKPVSLIEYLVNMVYKSRKTSESDFFVLDSFAGSGTTAHSVLKMNAEDGGNRRFILVELMDYAENITAERVKRVIQGYGSGDNAQAGTGGSFDYFELGPALMDGDALNETLPVETLREYVWWTETHAESGKADPKDPYLLGSHNGTAYYFCYERGRTVALNRALLRKIKAKAESYVVFADTCLLDEATLRRLHITFKKIPRDIARP